MKAILRTIGVNALALLLTAIIIPGFHITISVGSFLTAGLLLTIISFIVKPVLKILTLPFTLLTFGLFSLVTNAIVIWILQRFVPLIITSFAISRISFLGLTIPSIQISSIILAYIVVAAVLSLITAAINWLIDA